MSKENYFQHSITDAIQDYIFVHYLYVPNRRVMEPEKDFLDNATIMVAYAQKEIKQFLAWTSKTANYRPTAEAIAADLARTLVAIKELQKQYGR